MDFNEVYDEMVRKMNMVLALPYAIFATLLVFSDIYNNVFSNRIWAAGNIFLIMNSIYGYFQYFMSLQLAFERRIFLRNNRFLRIHSLVSGTIYNITWLSLLLKLFDIILNWQDDEENIATMFVAMVLSYNLIVTFFTVPINYAI